MGDVHVRDAVPNRDDALAAARYIDIASEGGIRKALGKLYPEIIATVFVKPGHDLSHQNTAFAERDGRLLGMATAYSSNQNERSSLELLREAPGNPLRRAMGLAMLGIFFRIIGSAESGDFYLEFLAVDSDARGQGVGGILLRHMEERGRQIGCTRFALDVSARNPGARRLYERTGMSVQWSWPRSNLLPSFVHRMAKDIP